MALGALLLAILAARAGGSSSGDLTQAAIIGSQAAMVQQQLNFSREAEREAEGRAGDEDDGAVFEEIAENLAAQGAAAEAQGYFARAADALGRDSWIVANEPDRLERLRARSRGAPPLR